VILVLTPSMGCGPVSTSSMYTPGVKYEGIFSSSQVIEMV
jgi:hypothetical protein